MTAHKYYIYPKYWDALTSDHTCPKIWKSLFYYQLMCLYNSAGWVANSVDPDQTPHSVVSDLGLQFAQACLSQYLRLL